MDNIQIDGNLGKAPERRESFVRFSIAVYAGESIAEGKKTKWFNCAAYDSAAENAMEFPKGAKVRITGRYRLYTFENVERDQIIVNKIIAYNPWSDTPEEPEPENDDLGDDIPF